MLTKIACNYNHRCLFGELEMLHSELSNPTEQDMEKALRYVATHDYTAMFFSFDNWPTILLYSGCDIKNTKRIEYQLIHSENSKDDIAVIDMKDARRYVRKAFNRQ